MGKHLSVEEKLNAPKEMEKIKAKIPQLRLERGKLKYLSRRQYSEPVRAKYKIRIDEINQEIYKLLLRKTQLDNFLRNKKDSKYGGNYSKGGVCYKLFKKKKSELTIEEARKYDRFMRAKARAKEKKNETH